MRQTFMTATCDKCGLQITFETLNVNCHGPIVATRDPVAMLESHGWVSLRDGLRAVDLCGKCRFRKD